MNIIKKIFINDKVYSFFKFIFIFALFISWEAALIEIVKPIIKIYPSSNIFFLFIINVLFLVFLFFNYKQCLIKDFKDFFKDFFKNFENAFKYWIIGFIIMIISNVIIIYIAKAGIGGNEEEVRNLIDLSPLYMIFRVSIYAPLTEELIFRKSIKDFIKNKWIYVIVSGCLFGSLHVLPSLTTPINFTDLLYLIPYCSLGIAFAYSYYKSDNIFSTISMHAIHNTLAISLYLMGSII